MAGRTVKKKNLSNLKRVRQAEKQRLINQSAKSKIKTYVTKLESALTGKDKNGIEGMLKETIKVISSVASRGIIHKNTASRKISRITKKVNTVMSSQ